MILNYSKIKGPYATRRHEKIMYHEDLLPKYQSKASGHKSYNVDVSWMVQGFI
jgi:hypothetical protein